MNLKSLLILGAIVLSQFANAQRTFQHPGLLHKKSDLDRMKYGIEAGIEPWASSFNDLKNDEYSSYNYSVQGDSSWEILGREGPHKYEYEKDSRAAYQNALMYHITGDQRHADVVIRILNSWVNIKTMTSIPLNAGLYGAPMINAAELIRHSDAGWAEADIKKFEDMLVYPGYSTTTIPSAQLAADEGVTFYWKCYRGDPGRHGNQELAAYNTLIAIGVFLDNDTIYDRALRYIKGQTHRPDDLPYEFGPVVSTTVNETTPHYIDYDYYREYKIPDYGYDGVLTNYIYDNGQCQESSRDQGHPILGMTLLTQIAEIAWNQGDDLYSWADNRLLLGLEYTLKYNVSYEYSYPDQIEPWEPNKELGEFYEVMARTGRWKSLNINPYVGSNLDRISRGTNIFNPCWEMPLNHYMYRANVHFDDYKWLKRTRDLNYSIDKQHETRTGNFMDYPGWGSIAYRRPEGCAGEPLKNIVDSIPEFELPVLPTTIEAENFDYYNLSAGGGESLTYHDVTSDNTGGAYRKDVGVDIETCSEGGYNLTNLEDGEWLSYTVYVPSTGLYNISLRYAAANERGKIKFAANGTDITSDLVVPFGNLNSTGLSDWKDYTIAGDVILTKGVQALKIHISGESNAFLLNSLTISEGSDNACDGGSPAVSGLPSFITKGINYSYYEGTFDAFPDFTTLTPIVTGFTDKVGLIDGIASENAALLFEGYIEVPLNGNYTFYTTSDEGSRVYIDGDLIVVDNGGNTSTEQSVDICLDEGMHALRVEYFDKTGNDALTVMYSGPGISKRELENLYGIGECQNAAVELPNDAVAGIGYYYYEGIWTLLPDFENEEVLGMGTTSSINLNMAQVSDHFAVVFTGYMNVAEDGDYTFYTTSDDGSALYIDGMKIVNNDGTHHPTTQSGSMCLAAGWHQIEVQYFESTGSESLSVQWSGEGFTRRNITGYYTKPISAPVKNNQTITFNSLIKYLGEEDFDAASASSGLPITYASYNTEVATVVNGKIHLVGEGEARIRATQSGNLFYNAANVQFAIITVSPKESQTITVNELTKYVGDEDFDLASASSGLPVTYTSYKYTVATIVEGKVHIVGPGTALIKVVQEGNYRYLPAESKLYTLTIEQQTPIQDVLARSIKVYPNPTEDLLYIQSENLLGAELDVISLLGEHIQGKIISSETATINLQSLNKGVYIIKITIDGKVLNYRVVKE